MMDKAKLKNILAAHKKWLDGKKNGQKANLSRADLSGADLSWANLSRADLSMADLSWANLFGADLFGADLSEVNLFGVNLYGVNLTGVNLSFYLFPSLRLLSSISLGKLSDKLTIELMRRDAYAHPKPELFDVWVNGGGCPYKKEERFWFFIEQKRLWKPGLPQMTDRDLILAICKEKGWGISGYLEIKKDSK
jgi:hypothetical protein